jgi:hypothetical protein
MHSAAAVAAMAAVAPAATAAAPAPAPAAGSSSVKGLLKSAALTIVRICTHSSRCVSQKHSSTLEQQSPQHQLPQQQQGAGDRSNSRELSREVGCCTCCVCSASVYNVADRVLQLLVKCFKGFIAASHCQMQCVQLVCVCVS